MPGNWLDRVVEFCCLCRPGIDCEAIFEPSQWKAVWLAVHGKRTPKKSPLSGAARPTRTPSVRYRRVALAGRSRRRIRSAITPK